MPELPAAYRWLALPAPPRMIAEALALYGTREGDGPTDNPAILGWARALGLGTYRRDATPWCGLFMAWVAHRAGKPVPAEPLWALSWLRFGAKIPAAALGDVVCFRRPTGGHVGLYVGEDAAAFHVLGGNQGDAVSIVRIGRARLAGVRRPPYATTPASVRPIRLAATGSLSQDEA